MLGGSRTSLVLKLLLSALVVAVFLVVSARLPYLQPGNGEVSWQSISGLATSPPASTFRGAAPAEISFADGDALFSGQFYLAADDVGFEAREIVVDGPCEGAGRRYLQRVCSQCRIAESPSRDSLPAAILWVGAGPLAGESGSVFRDCVAVDSDGRARVSLIEFHADTLVLENDQLQKEPVSPVAKIAGSTRVSVMRLGEWSIVVDDVPRAGALVEMESQLLRDGWQRAGEQAGTPSADDQRTYKRGAGELRVVSETRQGETIQLITMTNGL